MKVDETITNESSNDILHKGWSMLVSSRLHEAEKVLGDTLPCMATVCGRRVSVLKKHGGLVPEDPPIKRSNSGIQKLMHIFMGLCTN